MSIITPRHYLSGPGRISVTCFLGHFSSHISFRGGLKLFSEVKIETRDGKYLKAHTIPQVSHQVSIKSDRDKTKVKCNQRVASHTKSQAKTEPQSHLHRYYYPAAQMSLRATKTSFLHLKKSQGTSRSI